MSCTPTTLLNLNLMSKKILIISGPTCTGKTALAVKLAKKFNGELISADSRQVYRGMNIGTGKDHPKNIPIHLIDIINPDQSFSVALYQKLATAKINDIQSRSKLPIVVGGTGLYINSLLTNNTDTYSIKPNRILRFFLNHLSTKTLKRLFRLLDFQTFDSLNNSEINNPHRLIRKIEIRLLRRNPPRNDVIANQPRLVKQSGLNFLHLSLTAPSAFLYKKIDQRVEARLKAGLLEEIKNLLKKYNWSDPGLNCLAYKEFNKLSPSILKGGVRGGFHMENCIAKWHFDEHAFARRQTTWFKKDKNTYKFDITKADYENKLLNKVKIWYNKP